MKRNGGGKNNSFAAFYKNAVPQLARSGYLFSCLITCESGYKIGHEKQINKVLFPCVDMLHLLQFWHGGHK